MNNNLGSASSLTTAIYARYSTKKQNELSTTQQVEACLKRAGQETNPAWRVAPEWIKVDEGITGATAHTRPAFKELLAAVESPHPPFDVVIVWEWKRLSRELDVGYRLLKICQSRRVRLIGVADRFDSDRPSSRLEAVLSGLSGEQEIKTSSDGTRRGLNDQFKLGFAAGGLPYGYKSVVTRKDPREKKLNCAIEIVEEEARIVVRIFAMRRDGYSHRRIAAILNAEGVRSPRMKLKKLHNNREPYGRGWTQGTLRHMLKNPIYVGNPVRNQREFYLDPVTGKRRCRSNPVEQWITRDAPELRIVQHEMWDAVAAIEAGPSSKSNKGGRGGKVATNLLSEIARCGRCGGPMIVVGTISAEREKRIGVYGCGRRARLGASACDNSLRIRVPLAESQFCEALRHAVFSPEAWAYTFRQFELEVRRRRDAAVVEMEAARLGRERKRIDSAMANILQFIEEGQHRSAGMATLESLTTRLKVLEEERRHVEAEETQLAARKAQSRLPLSPGAVKAAVLPAYHVLHNDLVRGRELLRRFVDGMRWEPVVDDKGRFYKVIGATDFGAFLAGTTLGGPDGPRYWKSSGGQLRHLAGRPTGILSYNSL